MKNFLLVINFILLSSVAVLFYLHFSAGKFTKENLDKPTFTRDSSSFSIKDTVLKATAYINTDTLFEKYLLVKDMRDDLAAEKLKLENSYSTELKKLEKEVYEFQEKAPYMTQQEGESRQLELAEKEQKLMKLERDLTARLSELEFEKNKLIQKSVVSYLEKVTKEKNYAYIFGYNGMGNVLYANPQFDITDEIISGLNEEYKNKGSVDSGNKQK